MSFPSLKGCLALIALGVALRLERAERRVEMAQRFAKVAYAPFAHPQLAVDRSPAIFRAANA
jgi:hypothetical protein